MNLKSKLISSICVCKAVITCTLALSILGCTQLSTRAQTTPATRSAASIPTSSFKHIKTNLLEIAYLEYGPAEGEAILLYHGWPDSPFAWKHVAPELAKQGYRVLVPTLRGFGETRYLGSVNL